MEKQERAGVRDLMTYNSYLEFLRDHLQAKKQTNRSFNLSRWAKSLGLSDTASLARIMRGVRNPGGKIIDSFSTYFKFSSLEKEYFKTLVQFEKDDDFILRNVSYSKLKFLRECGQGEGQISPSKPLIHLDSQVVLLWGTADLEKVNKFLHQFDLESILNYGLGRASVCIKGAFNRKSELGSYSEFNFLTYVKKKDRPLNEFCMFIDILYCDSKDVASTWSRWGSHYEMADTHVHFDNTNNSHVLVRKSNAADPIISFAMGPSELPVTETEQPTELYGYNSVLGNNYRSKIEINTSSKIRDFDSSVDKLEWDPKTKIGEFLTSICYEPTYWSLHPDFAAKVYPPVLEVSGISATTESILE